MGVLANDAFRELQVPPCAVPDGRRMEQKPENVLESHEHPTRETKDNKGTERVERLKDNRRGLSVVIYNRDCKMVN